MYLLGLASELHSKMHDLLNFLLKYFSTDSLSDLRTRAAVIKQRQNLFMKQGMVMLIVNVMDMIFKDGRWQKEDFLEVQKKLYAVLGLESCLQLIF